MSHLTITSVESINNRVTVKFSCSGALKKFFRKNVFFVEYDTSIEDVPEAILIIPFLGTVCPIAWVTKADVYVDTIDETYLHALSKVKRTLQRFYPKMRFSGEIRAKNIVKPDIQVHSKSMTLFSGGLDSLVTYVQHRTEKPFLASIYGADVPLNNREAWNTLVESLKAFSEKTGSKLRLIRSNFLSMLNESMLNVCYARYVLVNWYTGVAHGLALLSLCASVAFKERVGTLYIASSRTKDSSTPLGSHPDIDNTVEWTGTKVVHDGYKLTRQDKIKVLADYIKTTGHKVYVRSCWQSDRGDNCSRCEKCSRTIVGLVLEGIDPNECGYVINADTFSWIKQNLMRGKWYIDWSPFYRWMIIQRRAKLKHNLPDSDAEELFVWLRNANLAAIRQKAKKNKPVRRRLFLKFINCLPEPLYITIQKLLLKTTKNYSGI
jgi:hypothetical protein